VKEYRVRFSTGTSSNSINAEVPPRLFQSLPQALSSDAVPDDVLLGEVVASPQHLQVFFFAYLGLVLPYFFERWGNWGLKKSAETKQSDYI